MKNTRPRVGSDRSDNNIPASVGKHRQASAAGEQYLGAEPYLGIFETIKRGRYAQVENLCTIHLQQGDGEPDLLFNIRGKVRLYRGDLGGALSDLVAQRMVARPGPYDKAKGAAEREYVERCLREGLIRSKYGRGSRTKRTTPFSRAVRHICSIVKYVEDQNYGQAVNRIKAFGKAFHDRSTSYSLEAVVHEIKREYEQAEDCAQKALTVRPSELWPLDLSCRVLTKAGKPDKALERLDTLLKIVPNAPLLWYRRARLSKTLKQSNSTVKDLRRAVEIGPQCPILLMQLYDAINQVALTAEALGALQRAGRSGFPLAQQRLDTLKKQLNSPDTSAILVNVIRLNEQGEPEIVVNPKKRIPWEGTLQELAEYGVHLYRTHEYRWKTDACTGLIKQYTYKGKRIKGSTLYQYMKDK